MKKYVKRSFLLIGILALLSCEASTPEPKITQVATPRIEYSNVDSPVTVSFFSATSDAEICFTTDGSEPDQSDFFGSTYHFENGESMTFYEPVELRIIAFDYWEELDPSSEVNEVLPIRPVSLSPGDTHSFNGVEVTLEEIFWFSYRNQYTGEIVTTDSIVLQFSVANNSGEELSTNSMFSWGSIIEFPQNQQLNSQYLSNIYSENNLETYSGSTILNGTNLKEASLFAQVDSESTSFIFKGKIPYRDSSYSNIGYYFEIEFDREDISNRELN